MPSLPLFDFWCAASLVYGSLNSLFIGIGWVDFLHPVSSLWAAVV